MIAIAFGLLLAGVPKASADVNDPLSYYGGPIVHSPTAVIVDWGAGVNPMYTNSTTGDPGLFSYLQSASGSTGDFGSVLAQYMDRRGNAAPDVTYGGQYQINPREPSTINDQQVQNQLVTQIDNGVLPQPTGRRGLGTVYLLLFPANENVCMDSADSQCAGSYFCAYHGDAQLPNGNSALYAVVPDNTTGAMNQSCGPASTPLANQTSYMSHEWSEAITDPLVEEAGYGTSWPLAWYDNNCSSVMPVCGEIGDKCNQEQGLNGGWTVQLEWSNLEMACEGSEPSYSAPTASFTTAASTYVGQPLPFDASASSDPSADQTSMTFDGDPYSISSGLSSYAWDWGDASGTDTGETASHTFDAPGLYQVSMTVTDNLGFTSTVTKPVVVWDNSTATPPDVSTTAATVIDDADVSLGGSVDPQGQPYIYSFAYGTSPDGLAHSTASTDMAAPDSGPAELSTSLSGLAPSTTYYYELNVDVAGQTYSGDVQSFTTSAAPPPQQNQQTGTTPPPETTPTPPSQTPPSQNPPAQNPPTQTPPAQSPRVPTPTAPQLPSAATGAASAITSTSATVAGGVDPDGIQTSYLVEFGTNIAYGQSSPVASAGNGQSSVSISATLSGLRARTLYHYRVVAMNAAGTAVGADRTFRTPGPPPPPPRFSFTSPSRITLAQALAGKLRVQFHCSAACTARFAVTIGLQGVRRVQAIPVTFARGSGRTRRAGAGQTTLRFTRAARLALRSARSMKLEITGYAVRGASAPSTPRFARLLLTR